MFESLAERVAEGTASPLDAVTCLAALSDDELLALPEAEALASVELTRDILAAVGAIQALAMEAYTRRRDECQTRWKSDAQARGEGAQIMPLADDEAAAVLAISLHQSPRTTGSLLCGARTLVNDLPQTLALVRAGRLEMQRALIVADEAFLVSPALRETFDEAMVHPLRKHARIPLVDLPGPQLRARVTRTATRVDPEIVRTRARDADRERFVQVRPGDAPGVSSWTASQSSDVSARAWAAIDALATTYLHANPAKTVGQCRADAMTDLILSNATVTTTLDLLIPVPSTQVSPDAATATAKVAAGARKRAKADTWIPSSVEIIYLDRIRAHQPSAAPPRGGPTADIKGADNAVGVSDEESQCLVGVQHHRFGIILSDAVNALLADPDIRVRLHPVDEVTGIQLGHDPTTYRPGKALADAVRARDQHCRFPGCTASAKTSDLDHVVPFPTGATASTNLVVLCRRHHLFKHHAGWGLVLRPDGVCTWTSPLGRVVITRPATAHDIAA